MFLNFSLCFTSKTQKFGPYMILESQCRARVYSFPPADTTAWHRPGIGQLTYVSTQMSWKIHAVPFLLKWSPMIFTEYFTLAALTSVLI